MTSISDMRRGDFVKVGANRYREIESTWGVGDRLAKPSEGGFGCRTKDGGTVSMWQALAYVKREDLPEGAQISSR